MLWQWQYTSKKQVKLYFRTLEFFIFSIVDTLKRKYGEGENSIRKCETCDYEQVIYSGGVHETEDGCLRVYAEEDKFSCPNCQCDNDNGTSNNLGDH